MNPLLILVPKRDEEPLIARSSNVSRTDKYVAAAAILGTLIDECSQVSR